jgi:hypothetical protein
MHHQGWASELKENGVFTGHPSDPHAGDALLPGRTKIAM